MSDLPTDVIGIDAADARLQALEFPVVDRDVVEVSRVFAEKQHAFSEHVTTTLTSTLHRPIHLTLRKLADEWDTHELDAHGCGWQIRFNALPDPITLHLDARALFSAIECSLGGSGTSDVPQRLMTKIEARVAHTFVTQLIEAWSLTWNLGGRDGVTSIDRLEHRPATLTTDSVSVFNLHVGDARGCIQLSVANHTIEPLVHGAAQSSSKNAAVVQAKGLCQDIAARLDHSKVSLVVNLAETTVRTSELLGLQPGDVITTDTAADDLLHVRVEGQPKFTAAAGSYRGQKAIRVAGVTAAKAA